MSVRLAVFKQKGGTGKTTVTVNLAAALAERGKAVLVVDLDGQESSLTAAVGIGVNIHAKPATASLVCWWIWKVIQTR